MKNLFLLPILAASLSADAETRIVALPSEIDAALAGQVYQYPLSLLERMANGDRIRVVSGTGPIRTLAEITKSPSANRIIAERALEPFRTGIESHLRAGVIANKGRPPLARLDLPLLLKTLSDQEAGGFQLILVGNPNWGRDPAFSFVDENTQEQDIRFRRPSHGHFAAPSRLVSPFSVQGLEKKLEGVSAFWWNPVVSQEAGGPVFAEITEEFWRAYLSLVGVRLAPIDADQRITVNRSFGASAVFPQPTINDREAKIEMLTLRDLKNAVPKAPPLPPLTDIFVADCTQSMQNWLDTAAREMSYIAETHNKRFALILFSDYAHGGGRPAFLFSESNNPSDLASAFRNAPLVNGAPDLEEAAGEGLLVCLETLRSRQCRNVQITIFTDAAAKEVNQCPTGSADFRAVIREIQSLGHHITLKACGEVSTDWVPDGVTVKKL